ncbi:MAG TPA: SDR family oxidoreductase, partial [Leptospiraceae bacterium]|nr:SDR family oxidoreductase [Leptospiraceae bacterium]
MNKKILVTGANKGIGLEITKQLTAMGHTVIMTGRSLSKLTEAKNSLPLDAKTDFYEMDVSSGKSILDAYEKIKDVYPYLDVIINNAGILIDEDKSLFDSTEDDFLKTIQTNSIGPFLVIKSFSNLLKKGGTIINISSGGGQITHGVSTWSPLYCLSKTLLNAITLQFAKALESK